MLKNSLPLLAIQWQTQTFEMVLQSFGRFATQLRKRVDVGKERTFVFTKVCSSHVRTTQLSWTFSTWPPSKSNMLKKAAAYTMLRDYFPILGNGSANFCTKTDVVVLYYAVRRTFVFRKLARMLPTLSVRIVVFRFVTGAAPS